MKKVAGFTANVKDVGNPSAGWKMKKKSMRETLKN